MDDGHLQLACSYGVLRIEYSVRPEAVNVRFDLLGPSPEDSYAQLWQDGELIGTRNGTPLFYDRDTEEGELNFDAAYPEIRNALIENAWIIDAPLCYALREGAGIDLSDIVRREVA